MRIDFPSHSGSYDNEVFQSDNIGKQSKGGWSSVHALWRWMVSSL